MIVGRVMQRDAIENQSVGMAGRDQPDGEVSLLLWFSRARHLPPAIVLAHDLCEAAPIDHAIAHDGRVFDVDGYKRFARSPFGHGVGRNVKRG